MPESNELFFIAAFVSLFPLMLAYYGWVTARQKAQEAILEARLVLPWQKPYTRSHGLLDAFVAMASLALLVIGSIHQPWVQDFLAIMVSGALWLAFMVGMILLAKNASESQRDRED